MGSVAIWSMHFIGNQAVIMEVHGLHIDYSPGFTAGSFFLPICGVGVAFYFFSISERVSILGTLVGGFTVGSAICGMHYMGNGGIANFSLQYAWPYVLGAAIIAVAASTIALGIFFYFKSQWTDNWLKRGLCGTLLAAAVSGMHWVATAGTQYRLKSDQKQDNDGLSRQATVAVVISLGVGACLALIVFAIIAQRSRHRSSNRAQQVVLASVTFDAEGRLMVTTAGLLPCQKITDKYAGLSFQDTFDINHPVFCWCFRASRCWEGVTDLVSSLRDTLRQNHSFKSNEPGTLSETRTLALQATDELEYSTVFKKLFLIAASELANTIQEPLTNLGVLFDDILSTGTIGRLKFGAGSFLKSSPLSSTSEVDSAERGHFPITFGRGQVLFAVRKISKNESMRLQASGYRFASVPNIIDLLAKSMEVNKGEIDLCLAKMRKYADTERVLDPGVYLGCFALRPLIHRGFEILVEQDSKNMLPTAPLPLGQLEKWQLDLLAQMDNWTVSSCLEQLLIRKSCSNCKEQTFARQLLDGIEALGAQIDAPFFQDARLVARPFDVPCRTNPPEAGHASLIAFRTLTSVHERTAIGHNYVFGSLRFFICQQHTYKDSRDNQIFARKLHREFSGVTEPLPAKHATAKSYRYSFYKAHGGYKKQRSETSSPKHWPSQLRSIASRPTLYNSSSSSQTAVEGSRSSQDVLVQPPAQTLGGIQVSSDINIDVREIHRSGSKDVEMANIGYFNEVGLDKEVETFAEKLMALTIDDRKTDIRLARLL